MSHIVSVRLGYTTKVIFCTRKECQRWAPKKRKKKTLNSKLFSDKGENANEAADKVKLLLAIKHN